jgi:hypothetical protein
MMQMQSSQTLLLQLMELFEMEGLVGSSRGLSNHTNQPTVQLRQKAIGTALCMIAGAYNTGLVSYFTHRDLFPSLMKVVPNHVRGH